jgi:dihydrofolate synthase / folylpolyglutamate synthase
MFTRIGAAAFKKDLTNTLALCNVLQQPQQTFRSIHIAGTNGKGSTSHMLASVLQEAGYKTGLYTSPHLKDFRERIRINGNMIPEQFVVDFVKKYKPHFDTIQPSFFEWTVALCFHYFSIEQVDVAIIETGLGGRLDSTNVITPELSVITNIGWDHTDMLGDTYAKIAAEKAGIIKQGVPVVVGEYNEETFPVFEMKARETNSRLIKAFTQVLLKNVSNKEGFLCCDVHVNDQLFMENMQCDLEGIYQQYNIRTVIAALVALTEQGYAISEQHIRSGLSRVKQNTGLMGRWQVLQHQPLMVADTGHNINGIEYVLNQIARQTYNKLHLVIGMVKDKDISKILAMLPKHATYYFTQAAIPRALPAGELAEMAAAYSLRGSVYADVLSACEAALKQASPDDMIFIGGSTFIVAEAL